MKLDVILFLFGFLPFVTIFILEAVKFKFKKHGLLFVLIIGPIPLLNLFVMYRCINTKKWRSEDYAKNEEEEKKRIEKIRTNTKKTQEHQRKHIVIRIVIHLEVIVGCLVHLLIF